jgi:chromosome segregation ATPase
MKLSLKHIKTALDVSTQKKAVSELVKSGTRSVRVISEAQVIRLIEVIVEDALAEAGHIDPEERDKVVAAAKERFDEMMAQQAETEARNKRQEETILSLQQRITQLVNEKTQLAMAQRELETQLDAAMRRASIAGEHPASTQVTVQAPVDTRTPEELKRLAEKMAQLQQLVTRLEVKGPDSSNLDARLEQLMARIEAKGGADAAALDARMEKAVAALAARLETKGGAEAPPDLDARMEKSMQRLIDRFGRTVAHATAKPVEAKRVEATDALIGKMLADDVTMASNIGELDVQERKAEGNVDKALEALRRTQKARRAAASNGAKDTATWDRRKAEQDRRQDPPAETKPGDERREGPEDRRNPL